MRHHYTVERYFQKQTQVCWYACCLGTAVCCPALHASHCPTTFMLLSHTSCLQVCQHSPAALNWTSILKQVRWNVLTKGSICVKDRFQAPASKGPTSIVRVHDPNAVLHVADLHAGPTGTTLARTDMIKAALLPNTGHAAQTLSRASSSAYSVFARKFNRSASEYPPDALAYNAPASC